MIVGIGSDLIDIRRVESTLERHGDRFRNRVFTEIEQKNRTDASSVLHLMQSVSRRRKPVRRRLEPA